MGGLKKQKAKLKDAMMNYVRTKKRIKEVEDEVKSLTDGNFPTTIRKIGLRACGELNEVVPEWQEEDTTYTITVPRGTTRKAAHELIQVKSWMFLIGLEH